jgi:hypothetical protein
MISMGAIVPSLADQDIAMHVTATLRELHARLRARERDTSPFATAGAAR